MARKKKKKSPKKSPPKKKAESKRDPPKKKAESKRDSPKKKAESKRDPPKKKAESKRDRGKKKAPAESLEAKGTETDIDVDLDAALDVDAEAGGDVNDLIAEVAEVAVLSDARDKADTDDVPVVDLDEPEDEPAEDLDAVIEDDLDESDDLADLIAATVAGASEEDLAEEPSVEAMDDEPVVAVLDDELEPDATTPAPLPPPSLDRPADPEPEQDLEGAIDLGDVSSPEVRDRLLAQALAHAELQDARYRVPFSDPLRSGGWKGAVASLLLLVAAITAVVPPSWVRPDPPAQIGTVGRAEGIRLALLLQAQQVEAFRVQTQRLPDVLDELDERLPGVRYVKSGNRAYQLIAYEADGSAVVYDSSDPSPAFERLAPSWLEGVLP